MICVCLVIALTQPFHLCLDLCIEYKTPQHVQKDTSIFDESVWKLKYYIFPLIDPFIYLLFVSLSFIVLIICVVNKIDNISLDELSDIILFQFESTNDFIPSEKIFYVIYKLHIGVFLCLLMIFLSRICTYYLLSNKFLKNYIIKCKKLSKIENYLRVMLDQEQIFKPNLNKFLFQRPIYSKLRLNFQLLQSISIANANDDESDDHNIKMENISNSHFYNFCLIIETEKISLSEKNKLITPLPMDCQHMAEKYALTQGRMIRDSIATSGRPQMKDYGSASTRIGTNVKENKEPDIHITMLSQYLLKQSIVNIHTTLIAKASNVVAKILFNKYKNDDKGDHDSRNNVKIILYF